MRMKRGQVWLETVLYTLVWLVLISLVLSFTYPRIVSLQEKALVEQTIASLQALDQIITLVDERGTGNVKSYLFTMKKGDLYIKSQENEIIFALSGLRSAYSEPGVEVREGRVLVTTTKGQKTYTTTLRLTYNLDITYSSQDIEKKFTQAPTAYQLFVSNENNKINIQEGSGRA